MNKYEPLLNYFDWLVDNCRISVEIPANVKQIYDDLKGFNKPLFTEAGIEILEYLQNCNAKDLSAKDIAGGMNTPSRKVSGALRKLAADGYVEKTGQNPVIYNLTQRGINFDIKEYKNEKIKEKIL